MEITSPARLSAFPGRAMAATLTETDFKGFCRFVHELAGIHMGPAKRSLVAAWLAKRLGHHGLGNYGEYLALMESDPQEQQNALEMLTTTETYFFREPRHFSFLADHIAPSLRHQGAVRVWSAACSTGEEPYTLAMVLMHALGHGRFEVLASDINARVLQRAGLGLYPMEAARDVPWDYRSSYCLKGVGSQEGQFLIDDAVRERMLFQQINLNTELPDVGLFDVIFLRNVLVYFSPEARRALLARLLPCLKPGGWLVVSHAESLQGVTDELRMVRPSIYQRPAR